LTKKLRKDDYLMDVISLIENVENFKDLEKKVYEYFCEQACMFMQWLLKTLDIEIMERRDKKRYRLKNSNRPTSITTLMGNVNYKRRYYKCIDDDGLIFNAYLLDKLLGINGKEAYSENVKETAVETALRNSFRKSEELIEKHNVYSISHQSIWNEVQKAGEKAKVLENRRTAEFLQGGIQGEKSVPVLFEEKDGVYLSIQGEKKKKEMKVAKVYEGWKKKTPGSKEYKTVNKFYVAGFEDGEIFDTRVNSRIASIYDTEKLKVKLVNADGAVWTKREQEYDVTVTQQLDLFHIHRAILRNIKDKKKAAKIKKYVNKSNYEDVVLTLEGYYDKEKDEDEREKIMNLLKYLSENVRHLPRYTERELDLPEGRIYRGMGTLEGSHHNVICDRMKNRGMSWSVKGAEHMAKLLCLNHSDGLEDMYDAVLPEEKHEIDIGEMIKEMQKESKKILPREFLSDFDKGKTSYGCHFSTLPFSEGKVTNGRKAIRRMLENNLLF
jgi:hypothetical protein